MARPSTAVRRALAGALVAVLCGAPALAADGARGARASERGAARGAVAERAPEARAKPAARRGDAGGTPVPGAPATVLTDVRTLLASAFELSASQRAALASIFAAQGQRLRAAQATLAVDPVGGARTVQSLVAETYRAVQLVLSPEQRRSFARTVVAAGLGDQTAAAADAEPARRVEAGVVYRFLARAVAEAQRRAAKADGGRAGRGGGRRDSGRRRGR